MIKVDVISGFLGAGKTTLIKKLYERIFKTERVALVENEFGEIGVDGAFLNGAGVSVKEINSGCICCSLAGNFKTALNELLSTYNLDRIVIEPSGVGKLSEVVSAVKDANENLKINILCTVVDANKIKLYHKNFGEFYIDQINAANTIVLSKAENFTQEKIISACEYIKQFNPTATIITTPVQELDTTVLLENLEDGASLMEMLIENLKATHGSHHHHEHEHHDHDHEHEHHDHEHEHHEHEHGHEHHEHGGHVCNDPNCACHSHHANEVFESFSSLTPKNFSKEGIEDILSWFDEGVFGEIIRAKGVLNGSDGWLFFDYVPGSIDVRLGSADVSGKVCVIGKNLQKEKLKDIF